MTDNYVIHSAETGQPQGGRPLWVWQIIGGCVGLALWCAWEWFR